MTRKTVKKQARTKTAKAVKPAAKVKSIEAVRKAVDELLVEIDKHKKEAEKEGLTFESLDEKELIDKERGLSAKSPYAYFFAWSTPRPRGTQGIYRMYIRNPDPVTHFWLYVTIFFGLGFIIQDLGQAWSGRDTRWSDLTTAQFSVPPNTSVNRTLTFTVPTSVPASTYLGNAVFWKQIFPNGDVFYRGGFFVTVT